MRSFCIGTAYSRLRKCRRRTLIENAEMRPFFFFWARNRLGNALWIQTFYFIPSLPRCARLFQILRRVLHPLPTEIVGTTLRNTTLNNLSSRNVGATLTDYDAKFKNRQELIFECFTDRRRTTPTQDGRWKWVQSSLNFENIFFGTHNRFGVGSMVRSKFIP